MVVEYELTVSMISFFFQVHMPEKTPLIITINNNTLITKDIQSLQNIHVYYIQSITSTLQQGHSL